MMKKLLCVLLSVCMICAFAGCTKNKESETSTPSDTGYNLSLFLKQGKIPEIQFALGTAVDTVKAAYPEEEHDEEEQHSHNELIIRDNGEYTLLSPGDVMAYYYYRNDQIDAGISSIVCFDSAFNLEIDSTNASDIKATFPNVTFSEHIATEQETYFTPFALENCSVLSYTEAQYRIDFFLVDDALMAVNIVNTEYWYF